ncbi:hypothetical protein GCM10027080_25850 [Pedococcus soli]
MSTPIDGIFSETGALGPMIGPKSAVLGAAVFPVAEVGDDVGLGEEDEGAGVTDGADWAASGCGGVSVPEKDFATRNPPTPRSTTVTAAAMLPRRPPNFVMSDIRRGYEPCEQ